MSVSFKSFKLNPQIFRAIDDTGYEEPTAIQEKVLPVALSGQDVMGIAQTGTGKTAAYLLPVIMKLKFYQGPSPRCLILAPTRELILQIEEQFHLFAKYTDLKCAALYGGIGPTKQIEEVEQGVDLLIATPGRFMDIYKKGFINLRKINTMVLDEADRMLDMGFLPQINSILEVIPVKRQNLLFSATMSPFVEKLSEDFLEFPIKIEITPQATAVETVIQKLYFVPNFMTKINFLEWLFSSNPEVFNRVLIFTRKKSTTDNIFKFLERKIPGSARAIHANKGQNSRINAINEFKAGDLRFLVSTDVTSRGIDVADVSHVINFDVPVQYDDYVHRIGRTGRAKKKGVAITLATKADVYHIGHIEKLIREKIPVHKLPQEVAIAPTLPGEQKEIEQEIDRQKRKENPDFKGAFHEKKFKKPQKEKPKKNKYRGGKKKKGK